MVITSDKDVSDTFFSLFFSGQISVIMLAAI